MAAVGQWMFLLALVIMPLPASYGVGSENDRLMICVNGNFREHAIIRERLVNLFKLPPKCTLYKKTSDISSHSLRTLIDSIY